MKRIYQFAALALFLSGIILFVLFRMDFFEAKAVELPVQPLQEMVAQPDHEEGRDTALVGDPDKSIATGEKRNASGLPDVMRKIEFVMPSSKSGRIIGPTEIHSSKEFLDSLRIRNDMISSSKTFIATDIYLDLKDELDKKTNEGTDTTKIP